MSRSGAGVAGFIFRPPLPEPNANVRQTGDNRHRNDDNKRAKDFGGGEDMCAINMAARNW